MDTSFERRCEMLEELGVKYQLDSEYRGKGIDRKEYMVNLFRYIVPPFSSDDWVNLCSSEGKYYLGGCCATMSALQDKLEVWFRFKMNCVEPREIKEVEECLVNHDNGEWWIKEGKLEDIFLEAKGKWNNLSPLDKLAYVWALVKGHYKLDRLPVARRKDLGSFNNALFTLGEVARNISWMHLYEKNSRDKQWNANQKLGLAKMLPAIKEVYDGLIHKPVEEYNGYALIDLSKDDNSICTNRFGLCIYDTLDDLWKTLDIQEEYYAKYQEKHSDEKPLYERYAARPVSITVKNGLKFVGSIIRRTQNGTEQSY